MCRLAAYVGPSIPLQNIVTSPAHSLLKQSAAAKEALVSVNGDGFGLCWYGQKPQQHPGLYKDVMPAWSDGNLSSICRMVQSKLFMAHVRASTQGETSRANCHPFVFENLSFMHNGQIPHFNRIKRELECELPDALYNARSGTTDSELFFLLLLSKGFQTNPVRAWTEAYALIASSHTNNDAPIRMTCVLADGKTIYAYRQSSDQNSPSLYNAKKLDNGGKALASEPLDKLSRNWTAITENMYCTIDANGFKQEPLRH